MKILVIDNIDSFVYNLVQYLGALDANPFVIRKTATQDELDCIIDDFDAVLISPGPGKPADAGISNYLIEKYHKEKPMMGVCLGHQAIAERFGGEVTYAKKLMHGKTSLIKHDGDSLFNNIGNPFVATRYHSLAVSRDKLPGCLKVIAETVDDNEIMSIKHDKYPTYGVQFHPESILTKSGMNIMSNFLELV